MNMYRKLMWAAAAVLALAPLEAQATTQVFSFETDDTTFGVSAENPAGNYNRGQVVGGFAVASVPGTATWLMMGLGLAALGAAGRRPRRRDSRSAFA
jgi:MYXO-CTERM domain-containing protein